MSDIDNFQRHMQITKKALLAYQVPDSDEKDDTYTMKNSISRALVMTGYTLLAALPQAVSPAPAPKAPD